MAFKVSFTVDIYVPDDVAQDSADASDFALGGIESELNNLLDRMSVQAEWGKVHVEEIPEGSWYDFCDECGERHSPFDDCEFAKEEE